MVELAVGSQYTAVQDHDWDDRNKLKALVTMENGANALTTALAEVRVKDPAFVRYHSSKLTVLLQDTIKASAKFLVITALPALIPRGDEGKVSTVIRSIQQLRSAVSATSASPSATHDRSLEGFMSRFTQQQQFQQETQPGALSLLFSSSDIQERVRRGLDTDGGIDSVRWEKELDNMNKRYGADVDLFATSFFQSSGDIPAPGLSERANDNVDTQWARTSAAKTADNDDALPPDIDSDGSGSLRHSSHETAASVYPHEYETQRPPSPPSSGASSRRAKSALGQNAGSSKGGRVSESRVGTSGGHSRTLPEKKGKTRHFSLSSPLSTTGHLRAIGTTSRYSARVTAKQGLNSKTGANAQAPDALASSCGPPGAPLLKIRRETASSTLKKSRLATLTAASPSFKHKSKRTPFK